MNLSRDYLFKIPFKQYSIPNWEVAKKEIMDALPTDKYTDFFKNRGDHVLPEYIATVASHLKTAMIDFSLTYPCPVMITSMWFERSKKGDFHGVHNHGATGFSAVLYVDFDPGEHQPTVFHSPFVNPANGDSMSYEPVVREGDLLVFPSFVMHEGPINLSEKERLIISFNIMGEDVHRAHISGYDKGYAEASPHMEKGSILE